MAEQNKEEIVVRSKVPLFRGGSQRTDSLSTLAWCESVDRQQAQQEWSEGKTAVAAIDSFREEAAEWIRVIQEEKPAALKQWKDLRPLVIARFGVTKSPAQRVALLSNLKQKPQESTETFYDRVAGAYYQVLRETQATLADPHKEARVEGFQTARNELLKLTYVAGLRQSIREVVEARMTSSSDLAWIREAAAAMEIATAGRQKNAYAAALSAEPSATLPSQAAKPVDMSDLQSIIRAELAALTKGKPQASQGRRPVPTQDPSKPRQPTTTEATKRLGPMGERGWMYCGRCCQWGLHIRPECKWAMDFIKSLPRQDQNERPSGTPSDKQYPNA